MLNLTFVNGYKLKTFIYLVHWHEGLSFHFNYNFVQTDDGSDDETEEEKETGVDLDCSVEDTVSLINTYAANKKKRNFKMITFYV